MDKVTVEKILSILNDNLKCVPAGPERSGYIDSITLINQLYRDNNQVKDIDVTQSVHLKQSVKEFCDSNGLKEKHIIPQLYRDQKGTFTLDYAIEKFAKHLVNTGVLCVANQWISVKERLPEKNGNSSIYCLVFSISDGIVVRPYNEYHKCWDDEDSDDNYTDAVNGLVTHWMPLPEPPKTEK